MDCPVCHYIRQPSDDHLHSGICPRCGLAYSKHAVVSNHITSERSATDRSTAEMSLTKRPATDEKQQRPLSNRWYKPSETMDFSLYPYIPWWRRIVSPFLQTPSREKVEPYRFWYRLLFIGLSLWTAYFLIGGVHAERIMQSFFA